MRKITARFLRFCAIVMEWLTGRFEALADWSFRVSERIWGWSWQVKWGLKCGKDAKPNAHR